jgi:uncharacterized small protein (DUF1192 family)
MAEAKSLAEFLGVADPMHPEKPIVGDPPSPNLNVRKFCRAILNSHQYRESLLRRVLMDALPESIERMIWDRAHGKVVDRVEVKNTSNALETMSVDELEQRALVLAETARRMRRDASDDPESSTPGSVH